MSKKQETGMTSLDSITKRLDALIRLIIEMNKPKGKEKFSEGVAARLLRSVDLSPTEIARILGKKSRTEISQYLYDKKRQSAEKDEPEQMENNEREG
jgi:hypothetical protein